MVEADETTSGSSEAKPGPGEKRAPAPAADAGPFPTQSPVDGSDLPAVEATEVSEIADIVRRAKTAQGAWAETPVRDRAATIAKVKGRILSRAEEIAELLRRECGKPVEEAALAEVLPNADLVDYWTSSIEE